MTDNEYFAPTEGAVSHPKHSNHNSGAPKRILYLRRRALLMELALIEDELGIERSVDRKK
jgi:hypothetical protein